MYYPRNKKVAGKSATGTNDQLYMDERISKESKVRCKNLAMGWIDYKKAYGYHIHRFWNV